MRTTALALHFARREFRNRYLGSFSGGLWALLQPLLQLGVYALVFSFIMKQRAPGSSELGYVPYLFVALWPWLALSESLQRSATSLQENASLITKVPIPRIALVMAPVLASFAVSVIGFFAILIIFAFTSSSFSISGIPLALGGYAVLLLFATGFALMLAPLQVFVRDIASALPQLTQLWMFLSPVLYGAETLPEQYRGWLDFNPYTAFAEYFRWALLGFAAPTPRAVLFALAAVVIVCLLGFTVFRRLQSHVEDFL
jgi:ABC-type polysaccharide/polyol phosphate export permease